MPLASDYIQNYFPLLNSLRIKGCAYSLGISTISWIWSMTAGYRIELGVMWNLVVGCLWCSFVLSVQTGVPQIWPSRIYRSAKKLNYTWLGSEECSSITRNSTRDNNNQENINQRQRSCRRVIAHQFEDRADDDQFAISPQLRLTTSPFDYAQGCVEKGRDLGC